MAEDILAREAVLAAARERVEAAVDHTLGLIDRLGSMLGLGPASTVLIEYDAAPVAISCTGDGRRHLIVGRTHAVPGQVLLQARRLSTGQTQVSTAQPLPDPASDTFEIGQALLEHAGQVATARVELVHGGRHVVATSVGRNAEERRLFLMAEAAARAVTEFLPPNYGVVLQEIHLLPEELGSVLKAAVLFLTPTEEQPLEGIAPVADDPAEAAARTVVSAVQERVKSLLGGGDVAAVR